MKNNNKIFYSGLKFSRFQFHSEPNRKKEGNKELLKIKHVHIRNNSVGTNLSRLTDLIKKENHILSSLFFKWFGSGIE